MAILYLRVYICIKDVDKDVKEKCVYDVNQSI